MEGVDYAGDHPTPAGLVAAGKRFVVRYGGPGGSWKHLTATEARALTGAGLALVANAEGAADGLLGGWDTGASWARSAEAAFRALGMPAGRPIYLSVDFDCGPDKQWAACAQALRGAASVVGGARVGVYGSYDVMQWAKRDRVARWFWQTLAWSGGRWAGHNHLEQYRTGVSLAGGTVDLCRSKTVDYGQWGVDDVTQEEINAIAQATAKAVAGYQVLDYITSKNLPLSQMWQATRADANQGEAVGRTIAAKLDAVIAAITDLAEQVAAGGGSLDTAAVIAAINAAADRAGAEARDAVGDALEGGAPAVRADADL